MTVKEVVLDIENRPGELARIFSHLYDNDVRVSAFWVGPEGKAAVGTDSFCTSSCLRRVLVPSW